ncbi:UDP-glucose--hexose-1-phosphate uridylyltransferase [Jeotgalibacillus proteolyticus]|uniref:Galactose-1-phosphate uridylyltransferase n=1 Tax=Jeotgalibacillus proteolyticus TaxID=2082395 RepID=A0A2S5G9L0_9BACL|nr:UDP-glucose--hexose-1-phosphate uridylyltransferase [Jeotgalibacillus proteolyticus]PPA69615.1 UDP-glucose--hexose-1-phosphate uridylyltransferase [Jeotgalibacillus proteolyticus]
MFISTQLERLIQFGLQKKLIDKVDTDYVRNRLMNLLKLDAIEETEAPLEELDYPVEILNKIVDWASQKEELGISTITDRDQLDAALMDCFLPRPSEVNKAFQNLYLTSPDAATDYFYKLSQYVNYIRTDRIAKNEHWYSETEYGNLEITINLSKPEKDPATIAAEKKAKSVSYPLCLLCKENVGYAGRINHPARHNHRIIPVAFTGESWFLQYSPYVYYNEHAIVFSAEHRPMKISKHGFSRLLQFVEQFPHYFVGSNADLPIVGGSILSHDHFQGGRHDFPMAIAPTEETFTIKGYEDIEAGIVKWAMSVIRLRGENKERLVELGDEILSSWKAYSDESVGVHAFTGDDTPHNTITPIARKRDGKFELDLVLRNNRTSEEHPFGIFHPHDDVHHIKKENIGLIEVMGLAVLPGRLKEELAVLGDYITDGKFALAKEDERTAKHADWAEKIVASEPVLTKDTIQEVLRKHVGFVFSRVLEDAGVFKRDTEGQEAFVRFMKQLNE